MARIFVDALKMESKCRTLVAQHYYQLIVVLWSLWFIPKHTFADSLQGWLGAQS
jgi:hypothetical protein